MSASDGFEEMLRPDADRSAIEDLAEGGGHLLDLVAAVDFLRRGDRHGLTVWDAIEEAVRWWTAEQLSSIAGVSDPEMADLVWGDPDPLRTSLAGLLEASDSTTIDIGVQQAVRRWTATMSALYNDGADWPHPGSRKRHQPFGF